MIGGDYFPAGVGISNNPYATARDPEVFPDPETYEPDRWTNATAEMRLMSRPFSIGPRNCIGRHLALIGLYVTVSRVLQLFDISTDSSMTEEKMRLKDQGVYSPWDETLLVWVKRASSA
jgi:cytochrome P450